MLVEIPNNDRQIKRIEAFADTHGAPKNILDANGRWGCPILREFVDIKKPKIHIFGHAHEDGGQEVTIGKTRFMNVAVKLNHQNIK